MVSIMWYWWDENVVIYRSFQNYLDDGIFLLMKYYLGFDAML